jgi:lysozyme
MKTSEKGLALIKEFEGFRALAYLCPAGVWTIGWGHTRGVTEHDRVTEEMATDMLIEDLAWSEAAVKQYVTVPLNQNQFDALVSFTFNLGQGALAQSTLLRLLNSGEYTAAALQFGRWVKAGTQTLPGLVRRREAERALFEEPADDGTCTAAPGWDPAKVA